jgi:holo-[acyl-carrier protein] synthase
MSAVETSRRRVARIGPAVLEAARTAVPEDGTIVGIGVDAVDVMRFRAVLARRPGFAARFALTEVEVRRGAGPGATAGAPSLVLHGAAAALAAQRGAGRFHLSLTHTAEVAVAFVVAERSSPCSPS